MSDIVKLIEEEQVEDVSCEKLMDCFHYVDTYPNYIMNGKQLVTVSIAVCKKNMSN